MRAILCLAAKGVVRDVASNNISVFSILERIKAEGLPFIVQDMGVLAVWRKEDGDPEVTECQFVASNGGEELVSQPIRIDFAGTPANRSVVTIGGLVVKHAGELRFEFRIGGEVRANYAIDIAPPSRPRVEEQSVSS